MGDFYKKHGYRRINLLGGDERVAALRAKGWTDEEIANYKASLIDNLTSPETMSKESLKTESEIAALREEDRKKYQRWSEFFLKNQPEYKIPSSVQGYVDMMTQLGNALGGIRDASGGSTQPYTIPAIKVEQIQAYNKWPEEEAQSETPVEAPKASRQEINDYLTNAGLRRPTTNRALWNRSAAGLTM